VFSLAEDHSGRIWIGTSGGLSCFAEGRLTACSGPEGWQNHALRKVYVDRQGNLWLGSVGGGLARFQEGQFQQYTTRDGLADNRVTDIHQDLDGTLWIATASGVSRFKDGKFSNYTRPDGLPHDLADAFYEDREGSLWIGTRGGGLARLRDAKFSVYTTKEGLANNVTKCAFEARDGTVWIGTDGGGLSRYRNGKFIAYSTKDGLPSNFVRAIGQDRDGNIWIGTGRPAGLCMLREEGKTTSFKRMHSFPFGDAIRTIFGDCDGNVWIGSSIGGLRRYRDGALTTFTVKDGLSSHLIRCVAQDRAGDLWIATNDGLCRYRDGQFTGYTTADGLAHNAVYAIWEDAESTLWLGTQGGLTRYKGGKFTAYTTRDGLWQNIIYQVLEDDQQRLWASGNHGVFSLPKLAVEQFDRGLIRTLPCVGYGVVDGMKTSQCAGGSQPAGCRTRDGRLWFPTVNGMATVHPNASRRNSDPPPVLIERVVSGNRNLNPTLPAKLSPGAGEFSFHYTALNFVAPEKVRFKYKLEELDRDWVDADTRRVAYYNKIPPGNYRFQVVACNNDGVWNDAGASFAFSLAPHFYQTGWFYALCIAAIGVGAWWLHRWRMRRAHAQFSVVLTERNRIARELHDTLAQGFAGIAFQLEAVATRLIEAPEQAQQHLSLALKMVRHSLAEARRSVMNLRSAALENGDLANALSETARQMMGDKPVDFKLETLGTIRPLPAKIENDLLRIGQESITNSLKYAHAGKIRVRLNYEPKKVGLRIEDDGQGFDPAASGVVNGAHFGLLGMHERAKQMGASLKVQSRPGQGTEVVVEVPLD
jgi:ligand-binding sensor domain-containing protein/two-component sensor histidine kinase